MAAEGGWYYLRAGGSVGPETTNRLLELLDAGEINRQTQIWRDSEVGWQSLEAALGLVHNQPPPLPGDEAGSIIPNIGRGAGISRASIAEAASNRSEASPHPWRRYFARMLDIVTCGTVAWILVGALLAALDQNSMNGLIKFMNDPDNRILSSMSTVFLAMFPSALLIGFTGSSLGKFLFGIRVSGPNGAVIGVSSALRREFMVWVRGLAFAIPIVFLFTAMNAYSRLKKTNNTSWDEDMQLLVTYRPATTAQMALNILGVIIWLGCLFTLIGMGGV